MSLYSHHNLSKKKKKNSPQNFSLSLSLFFFNFILVEADKLTLNFVGTTKVIKKKKPKNDIEQKLEELEELC